MSRAQYIEERAARWVLSREDSSWSATDQAELDGWLAESDAHKVAFWRLECGWRAADRIASLGAPQAVPPSFEPQPWWHKPVAIAASLALVLTIFLVQLPGLPFGGAGQVPAVQFATPVGGHKVVNLADGSRVELNTDTVIKAAVNDRSRGVWLERGEAFFDIAKQPGEEFVIHAGSRTITVLGTKFSVRRDAREVVVAVIEGRVRVEQARLIGRNHDATVTAGDVAIARGGSTLVTKSATAVQQQLAWRSGQLVFDGVTLASAADQFNRYNLKRLVIGDPDAARILVNGSFQARNVGAFARLVEEAYGLDVQDRADRIVLASRGIAHRNPLKQIRPDPILPRPERVADEGGSDCGSGDACALIPLSPPARQAAAPADRKALQDATNWAMLHKLYPPRALAAREEGMVGFTVKIDSSGSPTSCRITHTSGHPLLDLETCKLIMVNATFKRPAGVSASQQRSYEGVVNWRLPTTPASTTLAPPKAIAESAAPEQLICRNIRKTGSRIATERKCMTSSEWQRASEESTQLWRQRQGRSTNQ